MSRIRVTLDQEDVEFDLVGDYTPARPGNCASRPEWATEPEQAESHIETVVMWVNRKKIRLPDEVQTAIAEALERHAHEAFEAEALEWAAYMEEVING